MEQIEKLAKEFLKYEQAVELWEIGYDDSEPSARTYFQLYGSFKFNCEWAPLKSQVFKWFRENYNLYACIVYRESYKHMYEIVDITGEILAHNHIVYQNEFLTYEEAENACIDKLIKIVKQTKQQEDDKTK
jgi:hypothetical protein